MEELGGGGHQTMAAAQLENVEIEEAKERLIEVLNSIFNNLTIRRSGKDILINHIIKIA